MIKGNLLSVICCLLSVCACLNSLDLQKPRKILSQGSNTISIAERKTNRFLSNNRTEKS